MIFLSSKADPAPSPTTIALNGENYVFWGGREGYFSLLNSNMKRELDHLGMFLQKARDYQGAQPRPRAPRAHRVMNAHATSCDMRTRCDAHTDARASFFCSMCVA